MYSYIINLRLMVIDISKFRALVSFRTISQHFGLHCHEKGKERRRTNGKGQEMGERKVGIEWKKNGRVGGRRENRMKGGEEERREGRRGRAEEE